MRILLLLTLQLVQSSVIGIDFGQEWFKVSIVKPGIPLDIVLNKETKRKTNSIVALKNNKRLFGNDAIAASIKDPSLAHYPKSLLGSNNSSNHLVGLILQHAKLQAQVYGNDTVTGAVLTVPPYFKQHQRLALLDAADIADLRVISLFNDETAVALNYAMLRQFSNNTQYHIFFDMGAGSTVASLVSFKTIQVQGAKKGSRVRHVPQLTVEAVGYDEDLGGSSVDKEILNLLTRSFIDKQGKDFDSKLFLNDSRAMTRLLREASRVKQVLSANQETYASVESLYQEKDFKTIINRTQLESHCSSIFKRVTAPIESVLKISKLKVSDIDSLVLVGGGIRIPIIQKIIGDFIGESKIARNVNGDEAAVMGAGFRAASISTLFRVKEILVKDRPVYDINVIHDSEPIDGKSKPITTNLFNSSSFYATKKVMTFKRSSDFQFTVSYPNEPILTVSVTGIDKALETINEKKRSIVKGPSVKVLINLDQSGIILIEEVYFYAELGKTEGIVGNVMNFFGGKKNEEQEEDIEESLDKPNDEKVVKKDTDEKEKEPANTVEKINLVFTVKQSIPPLSSTEKQDIKAEIHKMDTKDKIEAEQQEGINTLESLVYEIKYSIEEDHIIKISTPQERQELVKLVQSTQEWLEDNLGAVIADINTKKQALLTYWSPITHRKFEHANRDLNFVKLTDLVNYTRNFINETRVNTSKLSTDLITWYVPESEYTSIEDYLNEVDVWIIDTVKLQSEKKDHENPIVTVKEIERKIVSVGRRTATFVKSKTWKKGPGAPTTDAPVPPNEGESKDDKKEKDDPKEDDEIKDDEELKDDESKENDSKDEKKEEVNEEL